MKTDGNITALVDKLTKIVAIRMDIFDQRRDGVWPPNTDLNRWRDRYRGTPKYMLPKYTVELNHFRTEVDEFVAHIILAINETEFEANNENRPPQKTPIPDLLALPETDTHGRERRTQAGPD